MSVAVQTQNANFEGILPFHPLADIFPLMNGVEFEQFSASIRESGGPREPIAIYEGKILDGRNRARACEAAGVKPQYTHLPSSTDPVAFVIDKNLRRRHLNESQRALAAAKLATMPQGARTDLSPIGEKSQTQAARLLNVGKRSVERASKVHNDGISELQQAVERGEIAVSAADEIARLPADAQPEAITRALPNGARAIMGSRKHPKNDHDYSPTPPPATRALIECVLPAMNISEASLTSVHEAACGEGHMAEVLREYFQVVTATDIHDYGYGDAVQDFLADNFAIDADWFITNPPFGDKAERFALKALEQARVGVAIFTQLRWLETIGRYERLFRDHPPTQIAFFCERVPLHMGRWRPGGSTATAYIWLLWIKGMAPRAPFWIPPGQRKLRSRPDDIERFTASPVIKKAHCIERVAFSSRSSPAGIAQLPADDGGLNIPDSLRIGHPANTWLRKSDPPGGGRE